MCVQKWLKWAWIIAVRTACHYVSIWGGVRKCKEALVSAPFRLTLVKLCCHTSCSIIVFASILH